MGVLDLQNKLVAVLGYGQEGRAVTAYLMKHGVKPVLFDQRPWEEWEKVEQDKIKALDINFIFGPGCFKELAGFDAAFRSPGIALSNPDLSQYTKPSPQPSPGGSGGLMITSQTKWFFEHCPAKIIGVTGTKGKGTACALIDQMLSDDGKKSRLTGNIGKTQPLEILDELKTDDWVVYELSSFQLQDLGESPRIAVVLMVTSEHLDYHNNQKEYISAKSAITKFQAAGDVAIINADFEHSMETGRLGQGIKRYFSTRKTAECCVKNGLIYAKLKSSTTAEPLVETAKLQLKGRHNWQNACAAVLAADSAGCATASIKKGLVEFKGLEHRLEFVAAKRGVKYYNDSFSTTPETAIAAIKAFNEPLIIILGGSSKNSDFAELGKTINEAKNIKAVILIGREAPKIKGLINNRRLVILEGAKTMNEIFDQIKSAGKTGDAVLLSPACASFDMFQNYQDRGRQFKQNVLKL